MYFRTSFSRKVNHITNSLEESMDRYMAYIILLLLIFLCIAIVLFLIHRENMRLLCSVSAPHRGTKSERKLIIKLLRKGVHPQAVFHDLYLRKRNGEYSQIDLVVALPQGLVCIEVKDYSGWIYGNDYQRNWTQLLNYGQEKNLFYNPIMQNAGHIRALREQSAQFAFLPIFNVVLFTRHCVLKKVNYSSERTYVGYTKNIKSILKKIKKLETAAYRDKREVANVLQLAVLNGDNPEIIEKHIDSVHKLIRKHKIHAWLMRILKWMLAILV